MLNRCLFFPHHRRLQYFGHDSRQSDTERQTLCLASFLEWRCRLVGQLRTWIGALEEDV